MNLTEKQEQGLELAIERFKNHCQYTCISGYAGTGKTELVKYIIAALAPLGVDPSTDVCYTAYTGKAVEVLKSKGNKEAMTLHKLLFESKPKPDGTFFRIPVRFLPYKIIVVDEVSMVTQELMKRLLSHRNIYYLFLGDPFQLPPVSEKDSNNILDNPHVFLDEIMRQEENSEIIQLSMKIRNMEDIEYMKGQQVQVLPKEELTTGMLEWADQVLVATNKVRQNINTLMRELQGKPANEVVEGDKIICLRNYWDTISEDEEECLVNGTIGIIHNPFTYDIKPFCRGKYFCFDTLSGVLESQSGTEFNNVEIDNEMLFSGKPCVNYRDAYYLNKRYKGHAPIPAEFAFAYAITVHKSQGSQWDKIVILEEKFPFDKEEHARWLYTAVTRGAKKIILVR